MGRTSRSFNRWMRIAHRWLSMAFVVLAAVIVLPIVPQGDMWNALSAAAIVALLLMVLTGVWMAVTHYMVKFRRTASRRVPTDVGASV